MASAARPRVREVRPVKAESAPISREQEILKEFEAFFDHHIGAKSPSELEQFERRSAEILEESRNRSNESASTHEKGRSSLKVRSR